MEQISTCSSVNMVAPPSVALCELPFIREHGRTAIYEHGRTAIRGSLRITVHP